MIVQNCFVLKLRVQPKDMKHCKITFDLTCSWRDEQGSPRRNVRVTDSAILKWLNLNRIAEFIPGSAAVDKLDGIVGQTLTTIVVGAEVNGHVTFKIVEMKVHHTFPAFSITRGLSEGARLRSVAYC